MQYNAAATKSGKGEGIPQNKPLSKDPKFWAKQMVWMRPTQFNQPVAVGTSGPKGRPPFGALKGAFLGQKGPLFNNYYFFLVQKYSNLGFSCRNIQIRVFRADILVMYRYALHSNVQLTIWIRNHGNHGKEG